MKIGKQEENNALQGRLSVGRRNYKQDGGGGRGGNVGKRRDARRKEGRKEGVENRKTKEGNILFPVIYKQV